MSDGFLGRWSRRKLDAREGKPLGEPVPPVAAADAPAAAAAPAPARATAAATPAATGAGTAAPPAADPPPTMDDVHGLTAQSDFRRFAARDVAPEVKNAALKKLFADPRFNVMDGLDVYIDDYSKPDPLPAAMARQLAGAAFLRLFDEPDATAPTAQQPRDVADKPTVRSVAQSETVPEHPDHADPDLRLQQDDAAGPGQTGDGAA
ncbi:DUF3306 domain-containing protein [Ramlibacter sp.]|uniref:DUF3306 domain-containing protein n=1 Tax=Ramlibacter sp. TaxID=1917967 RepID=UPI002C35C792|nr:DUF3306 domain-containing protein [Ramlibacter sp.]HWI82828.1 DUF3306 domain-containing protein [Ramlibacter sp.]